MMERSRQAAVILGLAAFILILIGPEGLTGRYRQLLIDDILFFLVAGLPVALVAAIFIFIMGGERPKGRE
ncbi:MAG: hypothetical protein D6733_00900 [Methanobacteriota archaeon]|nr:MAG: hypothetical protein D6733_00900 [Euryarchaeota archaeon]